MVDPVLLIIYVTTNNHGWCQQQEGDLYLMDMFSTRPTHDCRLGAIHICTCNLKLHGTEILYNKVYE